MQIEDNLRAGMTPDEARREALVRAGGLDAGEGELSRSARPAAGSRRLAQDVRYALRDAPQGARLRRRRRS